MTEETITIADLPDLRPPVGSVSYDDTIRMVEAISADLRFEDAGVPDSPYTRDVWAKLKREIAEIKPGELVDIPAGFPLNE